MLHPPSGRVRLPGHVAWSEPFEYDLDDRCELLLAYAQVMTEGLEDDVLRFSSHSENTFALHFAAPAPPFGGSGGG